MLGTPSFYGLLIEGDHLANQCHHQFGRNVLKLIANQIHTLQHSSVFFGPASGKNSIDFVKGGKWRRVP